MQSFKLYTRGIKMRTQLKWVSAFLVIISLVVIGAKVYYYFTYPDTPQILEELGFSPKDFFSKEIIIFASLLGMGLVVLLASMFAGGENHKS